ncbi:MAG TPA: hypothetical protein VIF14_00435 [Alphaproteobacteria bacterium]|jgi:hypothetical protein
MRIVARLLLLLLVASGPPRCVETEGFLGEPSAAEADERMIGEWYGGGLIMVSIRKLEGDPAGQLRLSYILVSNDEKNPVSFANFRAWRTTLDGRTYLNLEKTSDAWSEKAVVPPRMVVRFEPISDGFVRMGIEGKEVSAQGGAQFWLMHTGNIATAIRAGELKGRVEGDPSDPTVTITASREELRAFIAAKGPDYVFQGSGFKLLRLPNSR